MPNQSEATSPGCTRDTRTLGLLERMGRRLVRLYGPQWLKARQWDREFSQGFWKDLAATSSDPIYPILEKYSRGGRVLDLGCGLGNTANEAAEGSYVSYLGIDISRQAIRVAQLRTQERGRSRNVRFELANMRTYSPLERYRVILFRESLYYLPVSAINGTLKRYAQYLDEQGVLIARIYGGMRALPRIRRIIETTLHLVETHELQARGAIIVFR